MKILITGATGLLGREVARDASDRGHEVVALGRAHLDVTDAAAVSAAFEAHRPRTIIHCAAYTAVDRAESEPDVARLVNRDGTENVAAAASAVGAALVYISSDYVFDGLKRTPYLPKDEPRPLSVYGRTKLEGERAALGPADGVLIVRTSWLYGSDKGFVPTVLARAARGERIRVVDDQRGGPTWVAEAAAGTLDLLEHGARGIWHVANGGECSWYELAEEAIGLRGLDAEVEAISTAEFGAPARRPAYSVLDVVATEELLGRRMAGWRPALARYLAEGVRA